MPFSVTLHSSLVKGNAVTLTKRQVKLKKTAVFVGNVADAPVYYYTDINNTRQGSVFETSPNWRVGFYPGVHRMSFPAYPQYKDSGEDVLQAKVTPCFENRNIAIAQGSKTGKVMRE